MKLPTFLGIFLLLYKLFSLCGKLFHIIVCTIIMVVFLFTIKYTRSHPSRIRKYEKIWNII